MCETGHIRGTWRAYEGWGEHVASPPYLPIPLGFPPFGAFVILRRLSTSLIVGSLAFLSAACGDPTGIGSEPDVPSLRVESAASSTGGATLLACPVSKSRSATEVIGAEGGTLKLSGHTVNIPAGAVSQPTAFTISVPASDNLLVDVSAADAEHYRFAKPVEMTISYKRCAQQGLASFSAWYIERSTGAMIERMGGTDDKRHRSVTFLTDHLSGYAIAD